MMSFQMLLSVLALALLAVSVESSSGGKKNYNYDLLGSDLTRLYNSPVVRAEKMRRPLAGLPFTAGLLSHCGVRVTLDDDTHSQWLVHKGGRYGIASQTVVTDARHMSSAWEVVESKDLQGTHTVSDFVEVGGPNYRLFSDNCHDACDRMMDVGK